jgi:hypothetical protein
MEEEINTEAEKGKEESPEDIQSMNEFIEEKKYQNKILNEVIEKLIEQS